VPGGSDAKRGMTLPRYNQVVRRVVPRPVVATARDALRRYGTSTAEARPLPDYLVIGTKKGGTTSIINWLVDHPHVCRMWPSAQKLKSAHYYDINYDKGEQWYRSHFPTERARHAHEKKTGTYPLVGEASPYYMFHPAVPERVLETAPSIKAIALLRDPVSRAYSNYRDRRATGNEDLATFEEVIDAEAGRLASVDEDRLRNDPSYYSFEHDHHTYLARGRYLEHLQPWLDRFPSDQLLILLAEDMFTDAEGVFSKVQKFLALPEDASVPLAKFNERPPRDPMKPDIQRRLVEYYRPYNAALYDALGRDFGWEKKYDG
jgi:Sulfotransferase domain